MSETESPPKEEISINETGKRFDQYLEELQKIITQIKQYQFVESDPKAIDALYQRGLTLVSLAHESQKILEYSSRYYPQHFPDKKKLSSWDSLALNELMQELEKNYFNIISARY